MLISDLTELPHTPEVAVIINAGTKYVATLALLSALRYARIPTVLIDCESRDGSYAWFKELRSSYDFHLMPAPLRQHGETLDTVFSRIRADRVLLIDSDAEMLNEEMFSRMRAMLDATPRLYGSGYLHPGHWLDCHYWTDLAISPGIGYYMPRPWIPFTMLCVEPVRQALSKGRTFMHRLVLNDPLARLTWRRFQFSFFRRHRLPILDPFRREYDGEKPCYVSYDTGADIHEYLTQTENFAFEGVSAEFVPWSVTHFSGITRSTLYEGATADAYRIAAAHPIIVQRLRDLYGMDLALAQIRIGQDIG